MQGVARVSAVGLCATERWPVRLALVFSLGGATVAAYLVRLHAAIAGNPKRGLCTFTDTVSCDKVLASPYAAIGPIPVALVGVLGFVVLAALAAWRLRLGQHGPRCLPAVLALTAGCGLAFELAMTWVELFIIEAVCPYCLTALGLIAATFIASLIAWHAARRRAPEEIRHA
jgi:vitamin-K-epoxide reductase (warfarin-sensitive)